MSQRIDKSTSVQDDPAGKPAALPGFEGLAPAADGVAEAARERVRVIEGRLCLSSAAMEEIFGITRQALSKWAQQGCPKAGDGWWPLREVIVWRGVGRKGKASADEMSDFARKLKAEADWKEAQAQQLEYKNAIAEGDYIARDEIVSELRRFFVMHKRSLQSLSRKIASDISPFVDPPTVRRIERDLADMIASALETMATGELYAAPRRKMIKG